MSRIVLGVAVSLLIGFPSRALGSDLETAQYLFAGICNSREALRTGHFEATERVVSRSRGRLAVDEQVRCWFDHPSRLLRFDRKRNEHGFSRYALLPDKSIFSESKALDVSFRSFDMDTRRIIDSFDVRCAGIVNGAELDRWTLKDVISFYERCELDTVRREADGTVLLRYRIAQSRPGSALLRSLWVDEDSGFTVDRGEVSEISGSGHTKQTLISQWNTDWKEISGAWVPSRIVIDEILMKRRREVDVHWHSVNDVVDAKLFQMEGFGLKVGTPMYDRRDNQNIFLGNIGGPAAVDIRAAREASRFWFYVMLLVMLNVLVFTGIYLGMRSNRLRKL